jgi:serine/threonine protein phosphatase PrpC
MVLPQNSQPRPPLLVLADGMGGYAGGDQASHLVVEAFKRVYLNRELTSNSLPVLTEALQAAHADIQACAQKKSGMESMGSTVVAVVLHPDHIDLLNVGDSRAYILCGRHMTQISQDQSLVAEMVAQGQMTRAEAQVSPMRNQLNMAISAQFKEVESFLKSVPLNQGDGVLLCSDGLWGSVDEDRICQIVSDLPPRLAAARLVELANKAGGVDNISVVIASPKDKTRPNLTGQLPGSSDNTVPLPGRVK